MPTTKTIGLLIISLLVSACALQDAEVESKHDDSDTTTSVVLSDTGIEPQPKHPESYTRHYGSSANCDTLQDNMIFYVENTSGTVWVINARETAIEQGNYPAYQAASIALAQPELPQTLDFQALRSFCTGERVLSYFELAGPNSSSEFRSLRAFAGFRSLQAEPLSLDDITLTIILLGERQDFLFKATREIPLSTLLATENFDQCASQIEDGQNYLNCYAVALQSDAKIIRQLQNAAGELLEEFDFPI